MWVGNLMLVILNLPLIGLWVRLLTVPYRVLFPAIIAFACIGCYAIELNAFDVFAIAGFGLLGYVLIKLGCEPAPLLLGFVLGPLLEEHLRRAMIISRGDPMIFVDAADLGDAAGARGAGAGGRGPALGPAQARRGVRRGGVRPREKASAPREGAEASAIQGTITPRPAKRRFLKSSRAVLMLSRLYWV